MKKHFKRNSSSIPPQVEPDVTALINKIQQQLVFLEKKIDILIDQSSERPFEGKHFSKPYNGPQKRNFVKATCADCKKVCELPFKPRGDSPVYCRECFSKRNVKGKRDNRFREGSFAQGRHFDTRRDDKNRRPGQRKKQFSRRQKSRV